MIHTAFKPVIVDSFKNLETEHLVLVLAAEDALPKEFENPVLAQSIKAKKKVKKSYSLRLDAYSAKIATLHILGLTPEDNVSAKIAEYVRSVKEGISLYVWAGVDALVAAEAFGLGTYVYDHYLSEKKPRELKIVANASPALDVVISRVNAVYMARDLVNMPPNEKYPQKLAKLVKSLPWKNTKVKILGKKELEKAGFGMLLSVAAGSDNDPQVVLFERLQGKKAPKYAFVGKGVTFDSGGIQIKPDDWMLDMKMDMAGAAAVIATMWHLDSAKQLTHGIVGAIGITENMTGWSASKPLDIVRAHNGLTVEIHHTDAEWRLVLGDVVSYVGKEYSPENAITIATLTGACIHALGFDYAGLLGTSDKLVTKLLEASKMLPEKLWTLPINDKMLEATKSTIADRKNLSKGMKAGSSMGAAFIAQFVPEKVEYAHLDIAGPAYLDAPSGIFPSGGTGFGFYTLANLAK